MLAAPAVGAAAQGLSAPCRSLLAPAAMLSAFLAGACLSDGWLMNWGYSYLWERGIACFTHATALIGKVWFAPCTDTRYTKRLFPRLLWFSLISPLQHSSPQEIQQSTLKFLSEAERQEGLTQPFSLITFMIWNTNLFHQHFDIESLIHYFIWENNNLARKYNRDLCSDARRPCHFSLYMRCLPAYLLSLCLGGTRKSKWKAEHH